MSLPDPPLTIHQRRAVHLAADEYARACSDSAMMIAIYGGSSPQATAAGEAHHSLYLAWVKVLDGLTDWSTPFPEDSPTDVDVRTDEPMPESYRAQEGGETPPS